MARAPHRCPCHSGRTSKRCCLPFHQGKPAPTPEALMRSRYSAYALGKLDYLMATTHPESPHWQPDREAWAAELQTFCTLTRFTGLRIVEHEAEGELGFVTFTAGLEQRGRDASFTERSRFDRVEGRWLYHSGERID